MLYPTYSFSRACLQFVVISSCGGLPVDRSCSTANIYLVAAGYLPYTYFSSLFWDSRGEDNKEEGKGSGYTMSFLCTESLEEFS
jgi:hypothetical protein